MALLGAYKPKYETKFSGIAKQYPISSVVSLGLVPAVGSAIGKGLEIGRAMLSDTGDPMAMVKGKTQQVAGELSDYANGKAGKPTVSNPIAPATINPAPVKQSPAAGSGITFGNVGLPKMGPNDLSRLSSGALPTGRAKRPNLATGQVVNQPDEEGLRTPDITVPAQQKSAGERIFEMSGSDSAGLAKADIAGNGGFATMGDKTFVLPSRGTDEEQQYQAQQAQWKANQPGIAQAPRQTSTIGYSHGVYELAPGQNAPPDPGKLGINQRVALAGIDNTYSGIASQNRKDGIADAKLPFDNQLANAQAYSAFQAGESHRITAPAQAKNLDSISGLHNAQSDEIEYLKTAKRDGLIADADYKIQMGKVSGERLKLLKEQIAQNAKQPKGSNYDWKSMNTSAAEAIKLLNEKKSMGALTPEDETDLAFWKNGHKESWSRMRKDGYTQPQIQTEG